MARGTSGRVVVEVDPDLKMQLHGALASDGSTLKDWFVAKAEEFLEERKQPPLFKGTFSQAGDEEPSSFGS